MPVEGTSGFTPRRAAHVVAALMAACHGTPALSANDGVADLPLPASCLGSLHPANLQLHGMVTYTADELRFEECLTGRVYPIAPESEHAVLRDEYLSLSRPTPGAPIFATFDGAIELRPLAAGGANGPVVIVRRLSGLWPAQSCERALSHASLANQYWRVDRLDGSRVAPRAEASGDVYVILRGAAGGYVANAGCGRFSGAYRVEGAGIAFELPAQWPACPADLGARQQRLLDSLAAARRWAIQGQVLELFDAGGRSLAAAEAIYLH